MTESMFSFTTKADGDLVTFRGNTIEEFTANLLAAADPGLPGLLTAVQANVRGSQPTVNPTLGGATAATTNAPANPATTSEPPSQFTCVHGARVYKSGTKKDKSKWEAYFCPERGTDCKPMNADGTYWK